ncbi:MAG: methionyl-tRNA formyltransferase [Bacteroidetes bacterium MedPE-SWsnd-G2]|nr:MAG: methionyl-tRNA formyltransferase [Bacteroidetes bacterium MedPE-SWsnd-G2]
MGTPDFAVHALDQLIQNNYNIVGVITAPDKPAGRGRKLNQSAVKKYADQHNLNLLQPTNLKDEDFLKTLKQLNADLQIIVAFRMLPKVVWDMPKHGTFNLHASLLPQYRGAAPIHWSIINGETKTGVTTFFIDEKIDTGAIILKEETNIGATETVGELHDRLMQIGAELIIKTVDLIEEGKVNPVIQPSDTPIRTAYKLNPDNCRIDWTDGLDNIFNKIRGLNPFPAAWTELHNNDTVIKVKIFAIEKLAVEHNIEKGKLVIEDKKMKIAVTNGFIIINELQLAGKRKMDVKSLLNGYQFSNNAKLL